MADLTPEQLIKLALQRTIPPPRRVQTPNYGAITGEEQPSPGNRSEQENKANKLQRPKALPRRRPNPKIKTPEKSNPSPMPPIEDLLSPPEPRCASDTFHEQMRIAELQHPLPPSASLPGADPGGVYITAEEEIQSAASCIDETRTPGKRGRTGVKTIYHDPFNDKLHMINMTIAFMLMFDINHNLPVKDKLTDDEIAEQLYILFGDNDKIQGITQSKMCYERKRYNDGSNWMQDWVPLFPEKRSLRYKRSTNGCVYVVTPRGTALYMIYPEIQRLHEGTIRDIENHAKRILLNNKMKEIFPTEFNLDSQLHEALERNAFNRKHPRRYINIPIPDSIRTTTNKRKE